jgi:hypothetical protein
MLRRTCVFVAVGIRGSHSTFRCIWGLKRQSTTCDARVERYGSHKQRARTRYVELLFLHPVGSVGHLAYFGASGTRNVDALFFMLRRDRYAFHKKRPLTRYAELVVFASSGICE